MSLLTRCPACTTLYKVVPDQLRISEGWVKCGQCAEIFDASQNLIQASLESEEPVADEVSESTSIVVLADLPEQVVSSSTSTDIVVDHNDGNPDQELVQSLESGQVQDTQTLDTAASEVQPNVELTRSDVVGSDLATLEEFQDVFPSNPQEIVTEPEGAVEDRAQKETVSVPELNSDSVSFLHASKQLSGNSTSIERVSLLVLSGLLGLAWVVQWVYAERDFLAAVRPDWRPILQTFCQPLNCSVKALQRIESLSIDSATFNKAGEDNYRLSFTVRNLANLALALPSIELTLTDFQEQVVIRRILSPDELSAADEALAAESEWPVNIRVQLNPDAAMPRIAGYRLLAFYP